MVRKRALERSMITALFSADVGEFSISSESAKDTIFGPFAPYG